MRATRSTPTLVALALLSLGACSEDQLADPLAPAAVAEVARAGGDGEGDALSGRFLLRRGAASTCDCPDMDLDLCGLLLGGDRTVDLTQVDGYMTLAPVDGDVTLGMSGAAFRDGSFELAAIYGLDTLVTAGSLYTLLSGAFADDATLTAELSARLVAELPSGPVDCRATAELTGRPTLGG